MGHLSKISGIVGDDELGRGGGDNLQSGIGGRGADTETRSGTGVEDTQEVGRVKGRSS